MRPDGVDEAVRPEHGGLAQDLHAAARARPQGFIRTKEGVINCSGLPLIRHTTDERLEEIVQIHRDHGVFIADPHVYIVEDGKQGQVNPDVVATRMRFDPLGLLNPGKLRGCGQREQNMAGAASGKLRLTTLPRFWATPCRHRARRSGGEPGSAPLAGSC